VDPLSARRHEFLQRRAEALDQFLSRQDIEYGRDGGVLIEDQPLYRVRGGREAAILRPGPRRELLRCGDLGDPRLQIGAPDRRRLPGCRLEAAARLREFLRPDLDPPIVLGFVETDAAPFHPDDRRRDVPLQLVGLQPAASAQRRRLLPPYLERQHGVARGIAYLAARQISRRPIGCLQRFRDGDAEHLGSGVFEAAVHRAVQQPEELHRALDRLPTLDPGRA